MLAVANPEAHGDSGVTPLIACRNLVVDFGIKRALDRVSLAVSPGEIVGLVGANGAGKSTLGRVLVGEIPYGAYDGTIELGGREVRFGDAREAHSAGIALVHQEGAAVEQLTVGENVMLTIEPNRHGWIDWPALHDRARRALMQLGLVADTRLHLVEVGGVALVELVEIARSIVRGSRVYVFDESTAALGAQEIGTLLTRMRELSAQGAGIIFISHRIDEVLSICSRVIVLRDGRIVTDQPRAELDHASVVRAMLGEALGESRSEQEPRRYGRTNAPGLVERGPIVLELRGWRVQKSDSCRIDVGPIDVDVPKGEILGLFGPLGAGKTELLHSLYGLYGSSCVGECRIGGRLFPPFSDPRTAIQQGLALVSAERQKEGIVSQLSVLENMMLGYHRQDLAWRKTVLNHGVALRLCERLIEELSIQTSGPDQLIASVSGGNQQKVLLARALINSSKIFLLDEPTRGIDVGAKRDVYSWIRRAAAQGAAVIVSSLEEAELLGLADRILVLRDGRQLCILDATSTDERELLSLAAGGRVH